MNHTAVYPGTFDPITKGHIDIIQRAAQLFDRLIVVVADSEDKVPWLSLDNRVELVNVAVRSFDHITVASWPGLTTDFMRANDASVIIRGVRTAEDVTYELQLANMNRQMMTEGSTVFLPTAVEHSLVSSSIVREIIQMGGDATAFVSQDVLDYIENHG